MSRRLSRFLFPALLAILTSLPVAAMVLRPSADGALPEPVFADSSDSQPSAFSLQPSALSAWSDLPASVLPETCANDPVNGIDPTGLAGEGFIYAKLADELNKSANSTDNGVWAFTAELFSELLQRSAGYDPTYISINEAEHQVEVYSKLGFKDGNMVLLGELKDTAYDLTPIPDIQRGRDSRNSILDRAGYFSSATAKTIGLLLGGRAGFNWVKGKFVAPKPSPSALADTPAATPSAILGKTGASAAESTSKGVQLVEDIVGPNAKATLNEAGDLVIESQNGLTKVRFDINRTVPHKNPHAHVEVFEQVKNKKVPVQKSGPIYPKDVPHE